MRFRRHIDIAWPEGTVELKKGEYVSKPAIIVGLDVFVQGDRELITREMLQVTLYLLSIFTKSEKGVEKPNFRIRFIFVLEPQFQVFRERVRNRSVRQALKVLVEGAFCWIHKHNDDPSLWQDICDCGGCSSRPQITNAPFTDRNLGAGRGE